MKIKGINKSAVINNDDAWGTSAWDNTPSSAAWPDETQETPGMVSAYFCLIISFILKKFKLI